MKKTNDKEVLDEDTSNVKSSTKKKTTSNTSKTIKSNSKNKTATKSKKQTTKNDGEETKKSNKKNTLDVDSNKKAEQTKRKTSTNKKNAKSTVKTSSKSKKGSSNSTKTSVNTTKSEEESTIQELDYINPEMTKVEEKIKSLQNTSHEIAEPLQDDDILEIEGMIKSSTQKSELKAKKQLEKASKKLLKKEKQKKIYDTKDLDSETKSKKNIIYDIIIAICVLLIIYSAINIIIWQKNNTDNSALIKQVTEDTPIASTEQVMINDSLQIEKKSYDFSNLLAQNSDTVGWIHINNTDIDYPVVKGTDNDFYLKHAFDKSYNAAGWIYADYRNRCDDTDTNLIIYGHNRLNNNMFGTLENALSQDWLANESNHYINYSSINDSHLYSIFSIFICNSNESVNYLKTSFSSNNDFNQYIDGIKNLSIYNFDTEVTEDDKIITLYTCHGLNNERLIVCGKLII